MTFLEAFHSGCRFKLPNDYTGIGSWPDFWWWIKVDDEHYKICENNEILKINDLYENPRNFMNPYNSNIKKILTTNEWFLCTEDVHKKEFDEKFIKEMRE